MGPEGGGRRWKTSDQTRTANEERTTKEDPLCRASHHEFAHGSGTQNMSPAWSTRSATRPICDPSGLRPTRPSDVVLAQPAKVASFSTSRGRAGPKGPPSTRALSSARRLPRSKPPRKRQRQQTKRRDRSGPRPSYCAGECIANYKHATLQTTMHYIANRSKLLLSVNYHYEQTMVNYRCGKPNMLLRTT